MPFGASVCENIFPVVKWLGLYWAARAQEVRPHSFSQKPRCVMACLSISTLWWASNSPGLIISTNKWHLHWNNSDSLKKSKYKTMYIKMSADKSTVSPALPQETADCRASHSAAAGEAELCSFETILFKYSLSISTTNMQHFALDFNHWSKLQYNGEIYLQQTCTTNSYNTTMKYCLFIQETFFFSPGKILLEPAALLTWQRCFSFNHIPILPPLLCLFWKDVTYTAISQQQHNYCSYITGLLYWLRKVFLTWLFAICSHHNAMIAYTVFGLFIWSDIKIQAAYL